MTTLYLDPFSGLSGNMLLGVLFDLGLDFDQFQAELKKLNVTGYRLTLEKAKRSAIGGQLFGIELEDTHHHADESLTAQEIAEHEHAHEHGDAHAHEHHHHDHDDAHEHHHDHETDHVHAHHHHHHGRNLAEIQTIINHADLKPSIKDQALGVFNEIAQAEAHVHQLSLDEIHFHEVGALDSIVDIVGFFVGLDLMGIDNIISGTLVDGTGTIEVAHGTMPVPVPAVMQMRQNSEVPVQQRTDIHTELVTPTGFAIAKLAFNAFGPIPDNLQVKRVGYGFGTRETGHLNALRGLLLTPIVSQKEVHSTSDEVVEIHANVDDQPGEGLGYAMDQLMAAGAYDAYFTPIFMKKNRPAYQVTVITTSGQLTAMVDLLMTHTTTFGVRWVTMKRATLPRTFKTVTTQYGDVTLKIGNRGTQSKVTVEYDSAAALADRHHISLDQVRHAALLAYENELG
ncbi:nickel pincer cofactor biosynthesis protein LarC [Secundilactobacillus muriivasis]